jgi:hypothetical protein
MPKELFTVTTDTSNKDIPKGMSRAQARDHYLKLWGGFAAKVLPPTIQHHTHGRYILRADLAPGGLKSFGAERVVAETPYSTLVYCAPRQGHAPDAIASLGQMYDKKCVFFCPSSKEVSDHQASLFAYPHVDVRFFKIAAMPVLNSYAKKWAEENEAQYLPFGLTGNPTVTAGLVNMAKMVTEQLGTDPTEIWCAVSTGTMIRALQIGWPNAKGNGIAVARNIHDGEIGEANVVSATVPFLKADPIAERMPFPSTAAYDAKAWEKFDLLAKPGAIFINVGADAHINRNLSKVDVSKINSQREWGDMGDLKKNRAFKS